MSTESNKTLVRRFFQAADRLAAGEEVWREKDQFFAPDFRAHQPGGMDLDFEGFRQMVDALAAGFPGYRHTLPDELAEGDTVVARILWQGTHTAPFQGIPATHRQVTMAGLNVCHLRDGLITEMWSAFDVVGLMQQIGAIPSPEVAARPA